MVQHLRGIGIDLQGAPQLAFGGVEFTLLEMDRAQHVRGGKVGGLVLQDGAVMTRGAFQLPGTMRRECLLQPGLPLRPATHAFFPQTSRRHVATHSAGHTNAP